MFHPGAKAWRNPIMDVTSFGEVEKRPRSPPQGQAGIRCSSPHRSMFHTLSGLPQRM